MKAEEFVIVALAAGFIRSGEPAAAGAMLEHLLATSPLPQDEPMSRVACFRPSGGQTGHAGQPARAWTPQNLSSQGENWHSGDIPDAWTEELK